MKPQEEFPFNSGECLSKGVYTKESFKVLITANQHEWHLLEHCDSGQFRSTLQKVVVVTILHQRIGTEKWRTDFLKTCTQKPLAKFVEKCSFSCVTLSLFQGALASRLLGVYTNLVVSGYTFPIASQ